MGSTGGGPGDLAGLVELARLRMREQRALIVLDNAAGAEQVAPLLVGGPQCVTLVTSRRRLGTRRGCRS